MGKKPKKTDRSTTIFFLRHGRTDNPKRLLKGMAPFPLSKEGKERIKKQAGKLKKEKIAAIFTSPALRCQQTAQITAAVLNKGLPKIKLSTHLKEWTSRLDGQPEKEAEKLGLKIYNQAFEPKAKVLKRMKTFVEITLKKFSGQKIVAVSHQGTIDLLLFALQKKDTTRMPYKDLITERGEIIKVVFDQKLKILSLERKPLFTESKH